MSTRKKKLLGGLLVVAAVIGGILWYHLLREGPAEQFASDEEHFKYGSVGVEAANGIPYWVWVVLPRVFADKIPDGKGYRSFGFIWEDGRDTPVGLLAQDGRFCQARHQLRPVPYRHRPRRRGGSPKRCRRRAEHNARSPALSALPVRERRGPAFRCRPHSRRDCQAPSIVAGRASGLSIHRHSTDQEGAAQTEASAAIHVRHAGLGSRARLAVQSRQDSDSQAPL